MDGGNTLATLAQLCSTASLICYQFGAALLVLTLILNVVYQRRSHPLHHFPGPYLASLTPLWLTHLSWVGGTHDVMLSLHARYGKVVRIAPNELSIADPAAIKAIYGHGTKFRKSDWYSVWQGHRKFDLFPERNEKVHGRQRGLISRPYSMEVLREMEGFVDDCVKVFCEKMEKVRGRSGEGGGVDLGMWVQLFAFDVIGELTFSRRFGFMDTSLASPPQPSEFRAIETALRSAAWLGQVPWLYWLHDSLMPYIGNYLGINSRHGSLRQFAVREVQNRQQRSEKGTEVHQDILGKLLKVHEEKPEQLDMVAVQSMATSNIFAGSDTTAVSTRAVVYYLLRYPECMKRLVAEIDEAFDAGKVSDPIQLRQAEQMPYLQACLYEGLRMHPAVGMSLPRVVPEGGFEVQGHYLPAGTVVGTNPWVIHRDRSVFGEDADVFNPERWLQEDTKEMHRCFFSFGAGARMCLGRNLSWMEMSKLIPTLFHRYEVEPAEPGKEWTMNSWWFVMQKGLVVTLRPRHAR